MYYDYGGFGQAYFERDAVQSPHPAGYSYYTREFLPFEWYAEKINSELTSQGINPSGSKVLVVGCAYGYTVEYLRQNWDIDAYGMDISSWAVSQAPASVSGEIYQGDARSGQDLKSVRQQTPGGPFDAVVIECVLSCLTDSEAQTAVSNARSEAKSALITRVWSSDGSDVNPDYYNTKTLSAWQSLCDPNGDDYWLTEYEFRPPT
jgi:hypothetical protein